MGIVKYIADIIGGLKTLLSGMKVTGYYFFNARKEIITQQYPENRDTLKMFDRFRGEVIMPHDENNEHRCTGCSSCELICPNGSIQVISDKAVNEQGKNKKIIDKHVYHLSMCTLCNLCIEVCPTDAIIMGQGFEHAVYDRSELTKILNKPGSRMRPGVEDEEKAKKAAEIAKDRAEAEKKKAEKLAKEGNTPEKEKSTEKAKEATTENEVTDKLKDTTQQKKDEE